MLAIRRRPPIIFEPVGHRSERREGRDRPRAASWTDTRRRKYVDYVGNGVYTVDAHDLQHRELRNATDARRRIPFTITASTALTPPALAALTRPPNSTVPNTVKLPIDLNPGALGTDVFAARNVAPNPDGSLPGAPTQLFPDATTRTVDVRLDQGPGTYVVAARAKGFTGSTNPQAFSPWATPVAIRAFAPFDLKSFRWTDSRGPSYRFSATIMETSATGRVNIAIGRGKKGKYRSLRHRQDPQARVLQALQAESHGHLPDPLQVQGQRHDRPRSRDPHVPDHPARHLPGRFGDRLALQAGCARAAPSAARRRRRAQWRTVIVMRMLSSSCSVQRNL